MEISLDRETREILIDSFKYDQETIFPIITSKEGLELLVLKYGEKFNWGKYFHVMVKTKEDTTLMISKLETKGSFQEAFINHLKPRFESLFVHILHGSICLGEDQKDAAQKRLDNLQKIYEKLYPDSIFSINKLMDGEYPWDDDFFNR